MQRSYLPFLICNNFDFLFIRVDTNRLNENYDFKYLLRHFPMIVSILSPILFLLSVYRTCFGLKYDLFFPNRSSIFPKIYSNVDEEGFSERILFIQVSIDLFSHRETKNPLRMLE